MGIPLIDYRKIADAIDFYEGRGFELTGVPWVVSKEAHQITAAPYKRFTSFLGDHVASAEQSFLQLILDKKLSPGKYVSCSPCFRDDICDDFHHKWFMKVELIDFLGHGPIGEVDSQLDFVVKSAKNFFEKYLEIDLKRTPEGMDIVSKKGIELGSYGVRSHDDFSWVYGTGVAEPRLSQCLDGKKSYHLSDIARGKIGEASKIYEEVEEFRDSLKQDNPVMGLLELSDLIGAIEEYTKNNFGGTISLEDLIQMKRVTKRAFDSGKRE